MKHARDVDNSRVERHVLPGKKQWTDRKLNDPTQMAGSNRKLYMTFHVPQSRSRLIGLLVRRSLFGKSALMSLGAVVSTTVVLAGRGPELEFNHTDRASNVAESAISSRQFGLLSLQLDNGDSNQLVPRTETPDELVSPDHKDRTIGDRLYDQTEAVVLSHAVPDLGTLDAAHTDLSAEIESTAPLGSHSWKPKTLKIASLATPNEDWSPLESIQDDELPAIDPAPTNQALGKPDALDSVPEIGGLESGPVIATLKAKDGGETLEGMLERADLRKNDQKATLVALRADNISDLLFEGDAIDIAMLSPDDNQLLAVRLRQFGQPPVELRWDGDTDSLWDSIEVTPIEEEAVAPDLAPEPEVLSITGKENGSVLVSGDISSSLYTSAANAGLTAGETKALSDIFRYSVDFGRDLRKGDHFEALFEKKPNGAYGDILYAKLTNRGSEIALYRGIDDQTGEAGYFDAAGKTNKRTLMRTPLAGAQVSSHFGMRKHPILGYTKMHRGTDFRARTGTPIFAAGDGIVDSIGRKGAYGHYIRIRHNSTYETAYAHLSKYAAGLNYGDRVRQGEVIGYVGSTGRSTGPHLHFEIIENGNQINPMKIADFGPVKGLSGSALSRFKVRVSRIEIALSLMTTGSRVATAE